MDCAIMNWTEKSANCLNVGLKMVSYKSTQFVDYTYMKFYSNSKRKV